jgi:hypothetical protein
MIQYEKAAKCLDVLNEGEHTELNGKLYEEMAATAERGNDNATAVRLYHRAYVLFKELGLVEAAEALEFKVRIDSENKSGRGKGSKRTKPALVNVPEDSSSVVEFHTDDEDENFAQ